MPADRCPGVLRPHLAADGAMVRVRVPGGQTTCPVLARLGALARAYGSGLLQLTSRGGVQVRGLPEELPEEFVAGIRAAGLLPSVSHERVRNIVASPLTGLNGGRADLRGMITELDRALVATPELAVLSGRFLFALDDGRGDVLSLPFDLGYQAIDDQHGMIISGADRTPVTADAAVAALLALAPSTAPRRPASDQGPPQVPLGAVRDHASVSVPLGLLTSDQLAATCDVAGDGAVIITPWRGLIIPYAATRLVDLAAAGLVIDSNSPWTMITACVGAPFCRSAHGETLTVARELAVAETPLTRTHVSGCERRCGAPNHDHRELVLHG
jgi:precorrin-3B synthase